MNSFIVTGYVMVEQGRTLV